MTNPVGQSSTYQFAAAQGLGRSAGTGTGASAGQSPQTLSPEGPSTGPEMQSNATFLAGGVTALRTRHCSGPIYTVAAGSSDQTQMVQAALNAASASHGTVVFAPGTHTFGSVQVSSNTHVVIGPQATILASTNRSEYPVEPGSHNQQPSSLFNAKGASNIVMDGGGSGQGGTIDGQGGVGGWYAEAAAYHQAHPSDTNGFARAPG